ncbi:MAG: hypothetical protein KJ077_42200 [Anaerolineae bacterium]|nr:hypothetical protein [Anaerolineae bacterium]
MIAAIADHTTVVLQFIMLVYRYYYPQSSRCGASSTISLPRLSILSYSQRG